jgi:hypothetical protein
LSWYRLSNRFECRVCHGAKPLSVAKAVEALRERHPKKWAHHLDLEKRFYEAKKFWSYTRRLAIWADRWHANHPEN